MNNSHFLFTEGGQGGRRGGAPQAPMLTCTLAPQFASTLGHSGQNSGTRAPLDPRRTLGPEHAMAALRRSRRPPCRVPGTLHRAGGPAVHPASRGPGCAFHFQADGDAWRWKEGLPGPPLHSRNYLNSWAPLGGRVAGSEMGSRHYRGDPRGEGFLEQR